MEKAIETKILRDATDTFGAEAQMLVAMEECAELINALVKYRRGRISIAEVVTEIADVQIMCAQMAYLFGETAVEEERDMKMERLRARLETFKSQAQ